MDCSDYTYKIPSMNHRKEMKEFINWKFEGCCVQRQYRDADYSSELYVKFSVLLIIDRILLSIKLGNNLLPTR